MKKMCIAVCTACLIAFACKNSVFADTMCNAFIDSGGNVNLSIVSDADKEQLYTVYIIDGNSVLKSGEGLQNQEGFVKLEQITLSPDENKRYSNTSLKIKLTSGEDGDLYKAVVGGGELSGKTLNLVYPTEASSPQALSDVLSADENTVGTVIDEYQNKVWSLDLDNEMYKSYKTEVLKRLAAMTKEDGFDLDKMSKVFNNACALTKLAHLNKADFYDTLLKNEYSLEITINSIIQSEKDSIAEAFINLRDGSSLTTVSDLEKLLRKSEALGILNGATRDTVLDILNEYNDVFELDFNGDYRKVSSYELQKKLAPATYKSIEEVKTKFNNAVSSLLKPGSSGGVTTGGVTGNALKGSAVVVDSENYVTADAVEDMSDPKSFDDISEASWAEVYINYLQSRNVISGYGDGKVYPNAAVTREEFLNMLISALALEVSDEESENEPAFTDVNSDEWYFEPVRTAVHLGIVYGISEDTFGTGVQITREDAAVMLYRAVESKQKTLTDTTQPTNFDDEANISEYAVNSVKAMQRAGIISGYNDGNFLPGNSITRAESAKMIYSILKNLNEL